MEDVLGLFDSIFKSEYGDLNLLGKLLKIIVIFIIIKIIIKVSGKLIDKTLRNKRISHIYSSDRRANTLGQILLKIVKYILYFIGIIIALEEFEINTASILATAGIGGIAIGFGAQSLVKDIITGFFIIMEDQYSVGDLVRIDNFEGFVEELGLRVTKVRAFNGELHIIPNSTIQVVTNSNKGDMRALVKVSVSIDEDIDKVIKILEMACMDIKSSNENITDGPTVLGVTDLGEYNIGITIVAKAKPDTQWSVEREIRKKVKERFDQENIKLPYPKTAILGGNEV
ncbi:mechanosensitive ion channel family protein [Tissierella sp. Yu-01]|uniref:mechanosensitive ion channel family protein n=1 Tax=Tissierella sp. Yu-01 TaxID=3035694 RepID=UPI00240DEB57|nr:mechanosensitive ion channel family protein [Tissierella sp. Yu-01]WFA08339.1 mechanosensitive ion channel family protein [Tissierella sp. Yu-01]